MTTAATDTAGMELVSAAADLLSHFWSRPVAPEVAEWAQRSQLEVALHELLSSDPDREPLWRPLGPDDETAILDEYERLFVGPGSVPCPPYESFWHEDVPVDIRRSLMGPCTAELSRLYEQLGLRLSPGAGELPDHVAVELEALAFATSSEAGRDVARLLVTEHLASLLPRLCRAVAIETEHGFYRDLAGVTLEWFAAMRQSLDDADPA